MEDEEDKWYKKKNRSGKSIMKDTDKPLSTQAARFTNWMKNQYGDKVRVSSGDRGKGNHSKKNAFDIVGIDRLKKKDQDRIFKTALSMDVRVGNELKGKKGVDGWTGPHYHFDASKDQPSFIRGGTSGKAVKIKRTPKENKENTKWENRMQDLKEQESTEEIQGPPQQDQVNIQESAISRAPDMANTKKKDDEELYGPPIEEPRKLEPSQQPEIMMTANTMVENLPSEVNENMPSHLKDRVAKRSLNTDNIFADGAKVEQAQLDGEQPAIDDKFMSAIGFFLPAIIGGLVGQQSGEGGAGVQLGLQASGAYNKAKNAHAELQLKKQAELSRKTASKFQQSGFVDAQGRPLTFEKFQQSGFVDAQGRPLTFDPATNTYTDTEGNPAKVFKDPISSRQDKNLELRNKSLALRQVQVDHQISKFK
jgi:hypothetical protein